MILSSPLRKKGGIFIKKRIFFLIITAFALISSINVNAESANFHEAEYINGIYMVKFHKKNGIKYYQKARFFRKNGTNEPAYCIEPFSFFNETYDYESSLSPDILTSAKLERITRIAYFGYGYKNHTDEKWYAITQFMIWKEADSTTGEYYFTDTLNGNRIDIFQDEMNEINSLIDNFAMPPSFEDHTYTIVKGQELVIDDTNHVLHNYKPYHSSLTVENDTLRVKDLNEGNYTFAMTRDEKYLNKPPIFYICDKSQNLIVTGDVYSINAVIHINVLKTSIKLAKVDKDTLSIIPRGEAKLDGAVYNLYDQNNNLIKELVIENNEAIINNIPLGKYYLKEITPGIGYTIDDNTYEIDINENTPNKELILENKVIEKKIIIEKKFGKINELKGEKNISFEIYNKNNELIDTITTNEEGKVEIILPFGEYEFIQINSTEGYQKVDPFKINIEDNEEEKIELRDLKIEVPNTHTEDNNLLLLYILKLLLIIW